MTDRRERRPLPERGVSSVAVIVIGLAVLVALIIVVAAVTSGSSRKAAQEPSSSFQTTRFDLYGLAFAYPRTWTPQSWPVVSSFTSLITYLSPLTLHDPCVRTSASTSCGQPLASLPPGGVLVTWQNVGIPRPLGAPEIENPNTTIDGQPSRVTTERPGDCSLVDADETVTADITRPGGNHFEMSACLRQPGIASDEALIHLMLASVRVTS